MKQKITIPESLSDLTLEQYQKFLKVVDTNTDEVFIGQKMVQIFCDVPLLSVEHMAKKDFEEITAILTNILNQTPEFKPTFEFKGEEYGFIPNLNDDIKMGEFVDLDNLAGDWDEMVQFMSIIYRPITKKMGKKYLIEPYEAKKFDEFKDLPLDIVISTQLFFWSLGSKLLQHTLNSGQNLLQNKRVREKLQNHLELDGAGTAQLLNSLEMTSQKLMQSLNQSFIPAYFI
jgi:arsenate reductase-like glutaredoxin family protein